MSHRRESPPQESLDAILERVRRAHEEAEATAEGPVDRLEPAPSRPGRRSAAPRVDPGAGTPRRRAPTDIDGYDRAAPPTPAPPRDPDETVHRFRYPDYGAEAPVDSGEGKSVEDPDPTRTRIVPKRRRS
jgi:hypothetical protein